MGLRIAAACLIGAMSVTVSAVPLLAKKAPVTRKVAAKKATAARKVAAVPLSPEEAFLARNRKLRGVIQTASGVQYRVIKPATGAHPTDTDVALINYEGKLTDGTTFDKSQRPTPMPVAGVVPGFSEAMKLMPKGSKYRFWIKPSLGYGDKTSGPIPANSVLVFDVEMLDFLPEAIVHQLQAQQQQQQMGGAAGGPAPGAAPATASPAAK